MNLIKESYVEIKKSKFIGLLYKVDSLDDVKKTLTEIQKEHKKARHIPYAYKVGPIAKKTDDKEPSGTAGLPIWGAIERSGREDILVVVVRYFGGIKLGAGHLLRAYAQAANELFKE